VTGVKNCLQKSRYRGKNQQLQERARLERVTKRAKRRFLPKPPGHTKGRREMTLAASGRMTRARIRVKRELWLKRKVSSSLTTAILTKTKVVVPPMTKDPQHAQRRCEKKEKKRRVGNRGGTVPVKLIRGNTSTRGKARRKGGGA